MTFLSAGLFLDLRYNLMLSWEQNEKARRYLSNMQVHITKKEQCNTNIDENCAVSAENENSDTDEVEKMLSINGAEEKQEIIISPL